MYGYGYVFLLSLYFPQLNEKESRKRAARLVSKAGNNQLNMLLFF